MLVARVTVQIICSGINDNFSSSTISLSCSIGAENISGGVLGVGCQRSEFLLIKSRLPSMSIESLAQIELVKFQQERNISHFQYYKVV